MYHNTMLGMWQALHKLLDHWRLTIGHAPVVESVWRRSQWTHRGFPGGGRVQTDPGSGLEPQIGSPHPHHLRDHEGTLGGWNQMAPVPWCTAVWLAPLQWSPRGTKHVSVDKTLLPRITKQPDKNSGRWMFEFAFTFWLKRLLFIFKVLSMYSPSSFSAFPPPEERKPSTISTTSSATRRRSGVRSSVMISCLTRWGSVSY